MSLVLRSLGGDGATFPVSLATAPPGEWILATPAGGPHYFIRCSWRDLAEGELPDRTVLDRAAPGHPILSQAWDRVVPVTERQSLSDPPGGTALVRAASTATGCGHLLLDGPEAEGAGGVAVAGYCRCQCAARAPALLLAWAGLRAARARVLGWPCLLRRVRVAGGQPWRMPFPDGPASRGVAVWRAPPGGREKGPGWRRPLPGHSGPGPSPSWPER